MQIRRQLSASAWLPGILLSLAAHADGFVIVDFRGLDDHVLTLQTSNGRIHAQAKSSSAPLTGDISGLFAADVDGNTDAGFGQAGWLPIAPPDRTFAAERLGADGSFDILLEGRLQQRDALGGLLATSPPLYSSLMVGETGIRQASAFARQADGKYVIGGIYSVSAMAGTNVEWTVARLAADASALDPTFGGGLVRQSFHQVGINLRASLDAIHVLDNGKILASGRVQMTGFPTTYQTVIERFNADGSIDASFGSNAQAVLPDSTGITRVDSAGRIYLAQPDGRVSRLSSAGVPDGSYAGGTADPQVHATGLELDSRERAVVFGWTTVGGELRGHVSRLDANGAPDSSFNGTGTATIAYPMALSSSPPSIYSAATPRCVGALQASDRPLLACDVAPMGDADDLPMVDLAIARLTASGQLDLAFGADQIDSDPFPDDFSFPPVTAPYGAVNVQSEPVTVSGTNVPTSFLYTGAALSVGCKGPWHTEHILLNPGDTFCVRADAPPNRASSRTASVNIGGRVSSFVIESSDEPADTTPDDFHFPSISGVAPGALVTSAPITVLGITGVADLLVTNGYFSLNCDGSDWGRSYSYLVNGDVLCVSHYAAMEFDTSTTTTVRIGGTFGTFTSTTERIDVSPDAFAFIDRSGVVAGTLVLSNTIVVAGINSPTAISVVGGEYSVGCSSFTATPGTISNGQTVCLRQMSASKPSSTSTTTLSIGGVTGSFTTTTAAAPPRSRGGGGALDPLLLTVGLVLVTVRKRRRPSRCSSSPASSSYTTRAGAPSRNLTERAENSSGSDDSDHPRAARTSRWSTGA